jgi:dTDP-4-dehydrorhamnose 3,5-epimerase
MLFLETAIRDVYLIEPKRIEDNRGYFAILWNQSTLRDQGLDSTFYQANLSFNHRKGTLRGMHFQHPPYEQAKLIWCLRGAIYDVLIDIRPDSPTYGRWAGFEMTAESRQILYVPRGMAHGFQTLDDDTAIVYHVAQDYAPHAEGGIRYDDPAFTIRWPLPVSEISTKDQRWPDFALTETSIHDTDG